MAPLSAPPPPSARQALADLRARIDRIDEALHELLRERAEVVDQVRALKGHQNLYIRPGREAQMLRVLAGRPSGKLPEGLVVRLWREMISAFTLQEGTLKAAVFAPPKGPDLWDLARDHFGAFTPLLEEPTAKEALQAVRDGKATVAVLPPPTEGEKAPWWPLLLEPATKDSLVVFAMLPFEPLRPGRGNARRALPMGLIVGPLDPELTGNDRSFLALTGTHVTEVELRRVLGKAGYKVRQTFVHAPRRAASAPLHVLAEVEGYVGRADTRLGRVRAMMGSRLQSLTSLGGYAAPLKVPGRTKVG